MAVCYIGVTVVPGDVLAMSLVEGASASRLDIEGILFVSRVGFSALEMVIDVLIHGVPGDLGGCRSRDCLVFPVFGCFRPCCCSFGCCFPLCFLLLSCLCGVLLETWEWYVVVGKVCGCCIASWVL